MRIVRQPAEVPHDGGPVVLAVGFLDGVHAGHQRVIRTADEQARAAGGRAWVLTFEPHPLKVLRPESAPPLITPTPLKLRCIEGLGVEGCILMPFTPELARCEPEEFVAGLRRDLPGLAGVVSGANWTFGHRARGNADLLARLAALHGFRATVVEPVLVGGTPVSSTRVRQAVRDGDCAGAAAMLGRPFGVAGPVVGGHGVGRELGFPTANVDALSELHPPPGVYAVRVAVDGRTGADATRGGAAYIGRRPTFGGGQPEVLEVHVFDCDENLYGRAMEVLFLERLRGDEAFPGPAELRAGIARDIARARLVANAAIANPRIPFDIGGAIP